MEYTSLCYNPFIHKEKCVKQIRNDPEGNNEKFSQEMKWKYKAHNSIFTCQHAKCKPAHENKCTELKDMNKWIAKHVNNRIKSKEAINKSRRRLFAHKTYSITFSI